MWLVLALLSAVTASGVAIFGKLGLKGLDSTLATTIRAVIMVAFLLIVSLSLKKFDGFGIKSLSGSDWAYIILAGISGALSWIFYFAALKAGPASKVASVDRLSLLFVFVFSAMFLGEKFGVKSIVGAALMVGGILLLV
jgi:transporter family protein